MRNVSVNVELSDEEYSALLLMAAMDDYESVEELLNNSLISFLIEQDKIIKLLSKTITALRVQYDEFKNDIESKKKV